MRVFTAHLDVAGRPRLLREGFSWGALIFGPLWFAAARAWIPAALLLAAELALTLLPEGALFAASLLLAFFVAGVARDLVRWSWGLHGVQQIDVVAAPDREAAWQRLLDRQPDLASAWRPAR